MGGHSPPFHIQADRVAKEYLNIFFLIFPEMSQTSDHRGFVLFFMALGHYIVQQQRNLFVELKLIDSIVASWPLDRASARS
jgi:hypothetical protein